MSVRVATLELPGSGLSLAGDRWSDPDGGDPRGIALLLHGGGQTRHSWRRTGERLARAGWIAYAVDLRGHGDSAWPADGDYGMNAMTADIRELAAHVRRSDPGLPVALVGASLGGKVSLLVAGEDADLVQALVLVDIVIRVETEGSRRVRDFMRGAPEGFGSLEEAAAAISAYNPHRKHSGSLEGLKKNLRLRDGRWHWHWDPRMFRHDGEDDLPGGDSPVSVAIAERSRVAASNLRCPLMLVRGEQSDIVSDEGIAELRELVPHARIVDVTDVGHMVAGDDNDVFSANLVDFLDEAVASAGSATGPLTESAGNRA